MSATTRQHFILIARVLVCTRPVPLAESDMSPSQRDLIMRNARIAEWRIIVNAFADSLAQTNPRFNRAMFLSACEYTE